MHASGISGAIEGIVGIKQGPSVGGWSYTKTHANTDTYTSLYTHYRHTRTHTEIQILGRLLVVDFLDVLRKV